MTEERWKVPGFQGIGEHRFKITPTLSLQAGLSRLVSDQQ
jgi:hypothetical protein